MQHVAAFAALNRVLKNAVLTILAFFTGLNCLFMDEAHTACDADLEEPAKSPFPPPSVFVDLDGTLVSSEMGYTIAVFVNGLSNPYQRAWKLFLTPFVGISTKIMRLAAS